MATCGQIRRAGIVLLLTALFAMPGCGSVPDLFGGGEITPTQAISDLVLPPVEVAEATDEHFVMNWLLLGPFTFSADEFGGDQQQAAADKAFMPDEAGLNGAQDAPGETTWQEKVFASANGDGQIYLDGLYARVDHAAAYAVGWVHCGEPIANARLLVGSDDYITVWINGECVLSYKEQRRAGEADQDVVEGITLRQGYNRIVVKCVDVVRGWNFYLRFADKDSKAFVVKPRPVPAGKKTAE